MSLADKDQIISELTSLYEDDERYAYIINKGREHKTLDDEFKTERYQIKGCLSQLWLYPELKGDKVFFTIDSDAAIPKGIAAILAEVYSDLTPAEILELKPDFLKEYGIEQHLSMNRRNGLAHICKQIQLYAMAYKALTDKDSI